MRDIVFIGVPFWLGKKTEYTNSVEIVQASGIAESLNAEWVMLEPDFGADSNPVTAVNRALAHAVTQAIEAGKLPFVPVGDCTACIGMMKGLEQVSPYVVWYDAHGDFNTPETTPSGFLGGMPLAAMSGRGNQDLLTQIGMTPLDDEKIILIDGRDLDAGEAILVQESDIVHLKDVQDVREIDWRGKPVYIHFDSDVLRLEDLPAVRYPATGGPSLDETIDSLQVILESADVKAVLFTLWNQDVAGAEKSGEAMLRIIRTIAEALQA